MLGRPSAWRPGRASNDRKELGAPGGDGLATQASGSSGSGTRRTWELFVSRSHARRSSEMRLASFATMGRLQRERALKSQAWRLTAAWLFIVSRRAPRLDGELERGRVAPSCCCLRRHRRLVGVAIRRTRGRARCSGAQVRRALLVAVAVGLLARRGRTRATECDLVRKFEMDASRDTPRSGCAATGGVATREDGRESLLPCALVTCTPRRSSPYCTPGEYISTGPRAHAIPRGRWRSASGARTRRGSPT